MTVSSLLRPRALALIALAALVAAASAVAATTGNPRGVSKNEIIIGGSFPFTGPLAAYGALSDGAKAYFNFVNAKGGVNGRKIKYVTLDDGYDPSRLAANARNLVEQQHAFALLTFGGTGNAIRGYMQQVSTIQMNMGGLHDDPQYTLTKSWWPDVRWESGIETAWALKHVSDPKIGMIALNNDLGVDYATGIKYALGPKKPLFADNLAVSPAQIDVTSQLNRLRAEGVNTLVLVITGGALISALKYIDQTGWRPTIFVYSAALALHGVLDQVGSSHIHNLYTAMWLKDPADPRWAKDADVSLYKRNIAKYASNADSNNIIVENGYAGAVAFVTVLKSLKQPSTATLLKAWDALKPTANGLLLTKIKLSSGPQERIVHQYQVVQYSDGSYKPIGGVVTITH